MLIILIVFTLITVSFTVFSVGVKLQSINRVIFQTPKGLVETCIPLYYEDEEDIKPYFDQTKLESKMTNYYQTTLKKYADRVEVSYSYYNASDDSYCLGDKCDGVEITIDSYVIFNIKHHRQIKFEIRKGDVYGS